ncbi:hypothetical protein [Streptacidiphilus jiangxiensis]|uniref:Uncharacterized protein n=1 Tax=Streptacidiphilus jiangxiensis TaxID=235985 RepID=A0A1H7URC3_STRJI|nr:hypothetical protein [Streptacidiphilus jiangxiensis]SEL99532.1 hypothetical protein SAMN05414137_116120 [Streptacidiphilus jiangxiensis]
MRTEGVRDALRATAAIFAFVVQAVALFAITSAVVEASNVSPGDCGYDGTCTENGVFEAVIRVELAVPAAELALGLFWWALPLWRRRLAPGVDEWWDLVAVRLPRIFIATGLFSLLVLAVSLLR